MLGWIMTNLVWKFLGKDENFALDQANHAVAMNNSMIDGCERELAVVRARKAKALADDDPFEFYIHQADEDSLMRQRAAARLGSMEAHYERAFAGRR